jgi:hypothetical protein
MNFNCLLADPLGVTSIQRQKPNERPCPLT